MSESVWLERAGGDVPWGFRLHGGRDFHTPLTVQKVRSHDIIIFASVISSLVEQKHREMTKCMSSSYCHISDLRQGDYEVNGIMRVVLNRISRKLFMDYRYGNNGIN